MAMVEQRQVFSVVVRLFVPGVTEDQAWMRAIEAAERAMMDSGGDVEGYQFEGMRLAKPREIEGLELEDM